MRRLERIGRLRDPVVRRLVRDAFAEELLGEPRSLGVVVVLTAFMFLVGVAYYVPTLTDVPPILWLLYADSAVAVGLGLLSLATLVPTVRSGEDLGAVPANRPLAYLHTLAFVWLVTFGLWPLVALNLAFEAYLTAPDAWIYYWGVLGTHLCFVALALLFPAFGYTTPGALALAAGLGVANVIVDYGFGYHPPLLYEPGPGLAAATLGITAFAVWLAARSFPCLGADTHVE
ncbi:DUF1405 domain-containing protein [Halorubrum vacuolatum]|uniref:Uncharacterized membrane protein YpjA n=1 Tax=Halorubrum vacuolatum TaxID=63740 RepID=A0A238WX18_HALVU|nr:DUF1405 domain-containing protein [Halorubrum vacuolatum]SNR51165.1 Uncharacterized membrane protein YpjA [Halorubrum vacuolatum]